MLVDSHAHVSGDRFAADRAEVLARARAAGLVGIVDVGCDVPSSEAAAALAEADDLVWAAVGLHPHEARRWTPETGERLAELTRRPRVVAVGECGLDFYYDHSPREVQREVFAAQLRLGIELDMPVVLHIRDAYEEAFGILDAHRDPRLRGVAHCFTGDAHAAEGFVRRGFCVSFTGVVTFKNAAQVREAARAVPRELLLCETDCPYMAPVPLRGKRCEPAYVVHTARALAEARGEDPAALGAQMARNAAQVFGLDLSSA